MKKLVCFGDSITAGETFEDGAPRLTPRLRSALKNWEVINAGVSGDTTRDAVARIDNDVLSYHPDAVAVLFGANDAASHKRIDLEEYKSNLTRIVTSVTPRKTILIAPSPVDENRAQNRTNADLKMYRAAAEDVARLTGSRFIDLFSRMIARPDYFEFLSDGLHFTESGYEFLSKLIIELFGNGAA